MTISQDTSLGPDFREQAKANNVPIARLIGFEAEKIGEGGTEVAESVGRSKSRENAVETSNELEGAESRLRRVIDTIPALAWCARPDGSMEFLNRQWHNYTGLSPAETMDWGYQAAFHPEDRKNGLDKCRKLFSQNGPAESEIRLRRHDGIYRWFLIRVEPLRDETGQIIRWYGTSTDIEALKQTEERLREDERELRRITDAIPQAIVVQDPAGTALYANRDARLHRTCDGRLCEAGLSRAHLPPGRYPAAD